MTDGITIKKDMPPSLRYGELNEGGCASTQCSNNNQEAVYLGLVEEIVAERFESGGFMVCESQIQRVDSIVELSNRDPDPVALVPPPPSGSPSFNNIFLNRDVVPISEQNDANEVDESDRDNSSSKTLDPKLPTRPPNTSGSAHTLLSSYPSICWTVVVVLPLVLVLW